MIKHNWGALHHSAKSSSKLFSSGMKQLIEAYLENGSCKQASS